jgi:hypothetical protein
VAYAMAKADVELSLALSYAKRATRQMEEESEKITLSDLKVEDLRAIHSLAAYWDTLGWIDLRMKNSEEAERYLRPAWMLTQDGIVASHLCQVYYQAHKIADAVRMCSAAVSRIPSSEGIALDEAEKELTDVSDLLTKLKKQLKPGTHSPDGTDVVIKERNFKLPRFLVGTASAEFWVLFSSDGSSKTFSVEDVKFISGSDKMKLQGKQLKTVVFNLPTPSEVPTHFVRRGILGCYEVTGCSFVMLDPATVKSLD